MISLVQDLRFALRMLAKNPAYAAAAVVTLALGLGANIAIFTVVHSVVLAPLPYERPEELARVYGTRTSQGIEQAGLSEADFYDYRERLESVDLQMYQWHGLSLSDSERPRELATIRTSAGLLDLLGLSPLKGRTFLPEEEVEGKHRVVVLGYGFWQRELGGDPDIVGQTLLLDDQEWTVVGVMPEGFGFPEPGIEIWIPAVRPTEPRRNGRYLISVARLRPGATLEEARGEAEALATGLEQSHPDTNAGWSVSMVPLHEQVVGEAQPALLALLVAVGLVLLVACANVANLTLSRSVLRQREVAVRSALGAGRWRLARLLLTESTVLSLVGGLLGLALAAWGVEALIAASPAELPRVEEIAIDLPVLLFAVGLALLTGPLVGLLPAFQLTRHGIAASLRGAGRGSVGERRGARVRDALTVAEVALSLMLLLGAGLMLKSFLRLTDVDPGFRADGVAAVQLFVYGDRYEESEQQAAFFDRLLEEIRGFPGVESAGVTNSLPLSVIRAGSVSVRIADRPEDEGQQAGYRVANPAFFETLGIPVLRGRGLSDQDREGAPPVVLLNQRGADLYFPGESPLDREISLNAGETWWTVVGVVGNIRGETLEADAQPEIYRPFLQAVTGSMTVVARTGGDPAPLVEALQRKVWEVDPRQPVFRALPLSDLVAESTAQRRFYTALIGLFAALALVLAAVGLYGVISYSVSQRTQEIGIRMTLGARSWDVQSLVLLRGALLVAAGVLLGLLGGSALARGISGFLFGVSALDPATFGWVSAGLAAVALLACWLPARRAARLDPVRALREG